jgi:hypothetical protein
VGRCVEGETDTIEWMCVVHWTTNIEKSKGRIPRGDGNIKLCVRVVSISAPVYTVRILLRQTGLTTELAWPTLKPDCVLTVRQSHTSCSPLATRVNLACS